MYSGVYVLRRVKVKAISVEIKAKEIVFLEALLFCRNKFPGLSPSSWGLVNKWSHSSLSMKAFIAPRPPAFFSPLWKALNWINCLSWWLIQSIFKIRRRSETIFVFKICRNWDFLGLEMQTYHIYPVIACYWCFIDQYIRILLW